MLPTILAFLLFLILIGVVPVLSAVERRRQQVKFIRDTLAGDRRPDNKRIIASLSTVPDRIDNLEPTLLCLLNQTRPPDEIVIAIPDFSVREQRPYVVPKYLESMPRLNILRCGKDWGPATKFIPAIQTEREAGRADTLIMVVDDDRTYPRDALETYIHYSRELPDAALCLRGAAMPSSLDWDDAKMVHGKNLREPRPVAVVTGCGSYLVQPRFFDESLWDYSRAPQVAFVIDDIWISACLSRRGVKRYVVPASGVMRSVLRQQWTVSLNKIPRRQRLNNETIAFFRDPWDIFRPVSSSPVATATRWLKLTVRKARGISTGWRM